MNLSEREVMKRGSLNETGAEPPYHDVLTKHGYKYQGRERYTGYHQYIHPDTEKDGEVVNVGLDDDGKYGATHIDKKCHAHDFDSHQDLDRHLADHHKK